MSILVIIVFILGYIAIAFEHKIKLNKAAPALISGVLCWTVYILNTTDKNAVSDELIHHLGEIASILFFLMGAMTIVELIDSHDGFLIITEKIKTRSKAKLFWIITILTFFLSSILDNLTTAIVMTSFAGKFLSDKEDRLWFVGIIVIAANAGGVFSPLGDVTTTMLWIGGQITALNIIKKLFIPSIFVCLLPALIICRRFLNQSFEIVNQPALNPGTKKEGNFILLLSVCLLIFVPFFKMATHLPPFMGILLSLGILWIAVSAIHFNKPHETKQKLSVNNALQRIDTPSILFFLGILLAVSALQSFGLLSKLALILNYTLNNYFLIGSALGILSALIDNVPLVAAAQGMYDLNTYPTDHNFWEFLALTTGTGGSAIIIGSAAGVAAMGIEQVDFMWYLKKISWIALSGFILGIIVFIIQTTVF